MVSRVRIVIVSAILGVGASASAGIVPTAVFAGSFTEGFESTGTLTHVPSIVGMGGQMTILSDYSLAGVSNGLWGLGGQADVLDHTGFYGYGNEGSLSNRDDNPAPFAFNFHSPLSSFGGYFTANAVHPEITLSFYDANNNLLGTGDWTASGTNKLTWLGFSCTDPFNGITRIVMTGGESVAFDDLTANPKVFVPVPEPASVAALGFGVAGLLRHRRRA